MKIDHFDYKMDHFEIKYMLEDGTIETSIEHAHSLQEALFKFQRYDSMTLEEIYNQLDTSKVLIISIKSMKWSQS